MKAVAISSLAIAATLSVVLGDTILSNAGIPQFAADDLTSQHYRYRGTGRRQILS